MQGGLPVAPRLPRRHALPEKGQHQGSGGDSGGGAEECQADEGVRQGGVLGRELELQFNRASSNHAVGREVSIVGVCATTL